MNKPTGPKPNLKQTLEIIDRELRLGNIGRAETIAAHLRSSYPRRPEVNFIVGHILALKGDHHIALHFHKLAAESEPSNIDYLEQVGADLVKMGRIVEADAVYRRILDINPNSYNAAFAMARFFHGIGLGERAIAHYEIAVKLAPERLRSAINLDRLKCLVSLGRTAEVEKEFEAGIEIIGNRADYAVIYAGLDRWNVTSQAYAMLTEELQRTDIGTTTRIELLTNLARIQENSGYFDDSYETLAKAKRLVGATFDLKRFIGRVEEQKAAITPEFLEATRQSYGHDSDTHVFVIGMPRSGTTLTEQIIASHSVAAGVGELETMGYLASKLRVDRPYRELPSVVAEKGPRAIAALADEYEEVTNFLAPGKARVVDKMPHNFLRAGEISLFFPKARFVHCVRSVADTFISAFQNDMNPSHSYSYHPESYSDYYAVYRQLMRHWYKAIPGRIFTLEYEKLVSDPEPTIRALLDFLQLPFEEACLNPQNRGAMVQTFSKLQVRSAINAKSVGRWHKYEKHLAPLARRFEQEEPFPLTS